VWKSNPCDRCSLLPFIVTRGGAQGGIQKSYSAWQLVRPVVRRCPSGRIGAELRYLVVEAYVWMGLNCSFRDAWPSPRVVWACLSLPEYLLVLPRVSLSLGPRTLQRVLDVTTA
jgi:hypothetical protein